MQVAIDGQPERFAGNIAACIEFAYHLATRRHLDPLCASRAAQRFVGASFDAVLADAKTREDQQRVFLLLILFGGRCADIAEQMGEMISVWIYPAEGAHRTQAGHIGNLDIQRGKSSPIEIARYFNGHVAGLDSDISADTQFVFETKRQYFADLGEHGVKITDLLGDEFETVIGTVERQRFAAPIHDPATPRRNEAQLHPVLLGRQAILFALKD